VRVAPLRFPDTIIAILAMPGWSGRLVPGVPGFDPADDIPVQNARRARARLVERFLDMRHLPGIDIDKRGDRLVADRYRL
jgi:hypothetical protein